MKEKKQELGIKMNIGAIIKKAEETKNENLLVPPVQKKYYPMSIKVSQEILDKFVRHYYSLMKNLNEEHILNRSETFVCIINFMFDNIDINISSYENFYNQYIAKKGKRRFIEKTNFGDSKVVNCVWANFTKEQLEVWKKLLTKLAIKEGIEKKYDFSKQYFISDIIDYFGNNIEEIGEYIKNNKIKSF